MNKKKGATPTKAASNTSQWAEEDIDVVWQYRYMMDVDHFQMYLQNKVEPADLATINTKDHSGYIDVARVDPSTIIKKSVFSIVAYQEVLRLKGGDTAKFDKEVGTKFKKSAKGSQVPFPAPCRIMFQGTVRKIALILQRHLSARPASSSSGRTCHRESYGLFHYGVPL